MALALNRLNARQLNTITKPGRHADGGGLYLVVDKSGARRWVFLFRWKDTPTAPGTGRLRELGLGPLRAVGLAAAREAAAKAREQVAAGVDPIAARKTAPTPGFGITFGAFAEEYVAAKAPGWKNQKHAAQWRSTLSIERDEAGKLVENGYCIELRDRPIAEIGTDDVLAVLAPIWNEKNETASRLRGRIEAILDAATVRGLRHGPNPAMWKGLLSHLLPARQKLQKGHHAALPYAAMPNFIKRLRLVRGMGAFALEFTILTAARSGEVRGATWAEIDMEARLWTVPAARMKAARSHRVPLCARAIEILEIVAQIAHTPDDLVFPGQRRGTALSDMSLSAVLRRLDVKATVHGFRSSFRDWAGDSTSFPREIAEAALAHAVGDATEAAYRRSDALEKRRALMDLWGAYLNGAT